MTLMSAKATGQAHVTSTRFNKKPLEFPKIYEDDDKTI